MKKRTSKDQVLQKKFEELEKKNKESLLGGGRRQEFNSNTTKEN